MWKGQEEIDTYSSSSVWNGISPAISMNKDATVISDFKLPNVNEGSPKGTQGLQSRRCCHAPVVIAEELAGGGGGRWDMRNQKNRIWPQIAEVHMKGMNSASSEACIFPTKKSAKFLTLYLGFLT